MSSTKRLVYLSLLICLSLVIYVVELGLPFPLPISGAKLGLANMISLAVLILDGPGAAFTVLILRILLGQFLTGQIVSFSFSLCGGLISLLGMTFLHQCLKERVSLWLLSMVGGILHNIGQFCVALWLMRRMALLYYLPFLLALGLICGLINGLGAQFVILHLQKLKAKQASHSFRA